MEKPKDLNWYPCGVESKHLNHVGRSTSCEESLKPVRKIHPLQVSTGCMILSPFPTCAVLAQVAAPTAPTAPAQPKEAFFFQSCDEGITDLAALAECSLNHATCKHGMEQSSLPSTGRFGWTGRFRKFLHGHNMIQYATMTNIG